MNHLEIVDQIKRILRESTKPMTARQIIDVGKFHSDNHVWTSLSRSTKDPGLGIIRSGEYGEFTYQLRDPMQPIEIPTFLKDKTKPTAIAPPATRPINDAVNIRIPKNGTAETVVASTGPVTSTEVKLSRTPKPGEVWSTDPGRGGPLEEPHSNGAAKPDVAVTLTCLRNRVESLVDRRKALTAELGAIGDESVKLLNAINALEALAQ